MRCFPWWKRMRGWNSYKDEKITTHNLIKYCMAGLLRTPSRKVCFYYKAAIPVTIRHWMYYRFTVHDKRDNSLVDFFIYKIYLEFFLWAVMIFLRE